MKNDTKPSLNKLRTLLRPHLQQLGYKCFKDGVFAKKIKPDLYLSLSFTRHRFYDFAWTADYYFSITNTIGYCNGDIPLKCYERIGFLMTEDELKQYFCKEYNAGLTPKDVWWNGLEEESIIDFIEKVKLTETRLTSDQDLINAIHNSKSIKQLQEPILLIKKIFESGMFLENLEFTPLTKVTRIPIGWYKAAETAMKQLNKSCSFRSVVTLAETSYREYIMDISQ